MKFPVSNIKVSFQKHLIVYNFKEAYDLFKWDNPDTVIMFLKFCEFKSAGIHAIGFKDHEICC